MAEDDERGWRSSVTGALDGVLGARIRVFGGLNGGAGVSLGNPVFYVPRLASYPKWFAVAALDGRQEVLVLFVRAGANDGWRAAHWLGFSGKPPEIDVDAQGYAISVSDQGLPGEHVGYLRSGRSDGFTPDGFSKAARATVVKGWRATSTFSVARDPAYALRTKDGGALVWYSLEQRQSFEAAEGGEVSDLPGELPRYLAESGVTEATSIRAGLTWLAIGYAPAQGRGHVLGESVNVTDAG